MAVTREETKARVLRSDSGEEQMNGGNNINMVLSNDKLSDDLLSKIFDLIPTHDIYNARLVCHRWCRARSLNTYALVFMTAQTAFSMATRDFRVESSKLRIQRTSAASTPSLDMCLAFSGGKFKEVSLFLHHHSTGGLNTINFPPLVNRSLKPQMVSWGVAFAPLSKVWKVILFFPPDGYENKDKDEFHIITVGVNDESWRVVEFAAKLSQFSRALITEGFVHWSLNDGKVLSMNIETEVFTESPGPNYTFGPGGQRGDVSNTYLSTGRSLTLLRRCWEFYWEIWEMDTRNFEWKMTGDFSLEEHKSEFESSASCDGAIKIVGKWRKWSYRNALAFTMCKPVKSSVCFLEVG
ncbi:Unknown protein [Striga hermonthica]|uniref:F-box domain-containing protein n=1 Tax=Striga hermonthica TaxID=68872 RepID=A0A9N7NDL6_STRHE|nr:Unknown protein [Striga hermonthica]